MTEAMPFLQKYDITFLRPLPIRGDFFEQNFAKKLMQFRRGYDIV